VVGDNNVYDADCPTAITNNDRHRTSKLPFLHVNRKFIFHSLMHFICS